MAEPKWTYCYIAKRLHNHDDSAVHKTLMGGVKYRCRRCGEKLNDGFEKEGK